jgi:16S rRNA (adenine1518-N6/adenine1519-N6)-dimethyltransferase
MPKKHLSQNFLFDPSILRRIVDAAGVTGDDTVVEIGPGPGSLTHHLAGSAGRLIAIEFDRELHGRLLAEFSGMSHVEIFQGDALKFPFERIQDPFKVVANIPYHITTPIIFKLLEHKDRLISMTLTVQKELARRVAAGPGGKDYGVLSLMVQYHGIPEYKFTIPAGAFRPRPKVDSACLHIAVRESPAVHVADEELLFAVIRTTFSMRRKTLLNSLKALSPLAAGALKAAGIDPGLRPEVLSLDDFAHIADELKKISG